MHQAVKTYLLPNKAPRHEDLSLVYLNTRPWRLTA